MTVAAHGRRGGWGLAFVAALGLGAGPGERGLVEAAKERDAAAVRALVQAHADVNARQGDGATALHWAAHWDDADTAELLLRAGAKVDAADDRGVTPLSLACVNGSVAMVERLLAAGADPNLARTSGETPLMTASRSGNLEVVGRLLAKGADVNGKEAGGQTALMWAVAENHLDIVRTLIERGADVRARSKGRFTALLFAAQQGHVEAARRLLDAGADANDAAPEGIGGDTNTRVPSPEAVISALQMAIDSDHEPVAALILERGANPSTRGAGRTALHSAVQWAMPDLVKALLAHGADPNARLEKPMPLLSRFIGQQTGLEVNTVGATPFWLAASYADARIMRLLLDGGADPSLVTADHTTPLMVAAGVDFVEGQDKYGHRWFQDSTMPLQLAAREAAEMCLKLGNDVNTANDKGQTALIGAVYFRGTLLVQYLVDRGAKIDVKNKRGQTPWSIASVGEYRSGSFYQAPETAALLARLGADPKLGQDLGADFQRKLSANSKSDKPDN